MRTLTHMPPPQPQHTKFLDEAERSLHDAIMIVRRALKSPAVVPGGGAIDMELSKHLR